MKLAMFLYACFPLASVLACGGMSLTDQTAVRQEAQLNTMSYARAEAGSPESALARGSYCIDVGIARRNGVPLPEGGIDCDSP